MAKLWITEYTTMGADASGMSMPIAKHPPTAVQTPSPLVRPAHKALPLLQAPGLCACALMPPAILLLLKTRRQPLTTPR